MKKRTTAVTVYPQGGMSRGTVSSVTPSAPVNCKVLNDALKVVFKLLIAVTSISSHSAVGYVVQCSYHR